MPASARAATSAGSVFGSSFTQARAVVRRYSAMPPSLLLRPGKKALSHCMSRPARQGRHMPQLGCGCRMTVSPTFTLVTPSPTSCTQPAFSCPITYGRSGFWAASQSPLMMCRSVRQTPAPPIFTITSSGPCRVGSGISSIVGSEWYAWTRTAFISDLLVVEWGRFQQPAPVTVFVSTADDPGCPPPFAPNGNPQGRMPRRECASMAA